ncbi:MAG: hypothetical protein HFI93_11590 [Lachnospiraceae bacterium]|nr:hypothetical protein [Lachnospiraceae bacterium]
MKCYLVRDLLPNYIDGLTGEESGREIREHLESCEACRAAYEQMSAELPEEAAPEDNDIDFLGKLKKKFRRKYATLPLTACAALLCLLIGVMFFARRYHIPAPYDPACMTAEIYQAAPVVNQYGNVQWVDLDALDFEDVKAVVSGEKETIDLVRLIVSKNIRCDNIRSRGRTIRRGGETVRVVYYCYTRTLWNEWFQDDTGFFDRSTSTAAIYEGMDLYQADHRPQMREIYYLPLGNMEKLDALSDEAFDAQRKNATLVWKGVI